MVNPEGKVLVIKRRDNGRLQPPGGMLELMETVETGLRREILEETGIEEVEAFDLADRGRRRRLGQSVVIPLC